MKVIGIIPARGGSKGIPGKNLRPVCGKPLIQYSIEAALESRLISEIWVSSDDEKILTESKKHGVKLHKRAEIISTDTSPVSDTISEIIKVAGRVFDYFVLLQPTSPIRTGKQIDGAINLLNNSPEANSVISVCKMSDMHPARMYWGDSGELNPILPEYETERRQEIKPAFYRNGSIYVVRIAEFIKKKSVFVKPSLGFEMPLAQLLNIDEPHDLLIAEALISAWIKGELS